jgi:hypothetical protein
MGVFEIAWFLVKAALALALVVGAPVALIYLIVTPGPRVQKAIDEMPEKLRHSGSHEEHLAYFNEKLYGSKKGPKWWRPVL